MKSWERKFTKARKAEANFRRRAYKGTEAAIKSSGWVEDNGVYRFKVGPDPFDHFELADYFSDFLGNYRSGLDHMVASYALHHQLPIKFAEYPIRLNKQRLKTKIHGWRWDAQLKTPIEDFITQHQPFSKPATFGCLQKLADFRNTDEHRIIIKPTPIVQVEKNAKIYSEGGSVTTTLHAPRNLGPDGYWHANDANLKEAKFDEYFGTGIQTSHRVSFEHEVRVRFNATDYTRPTPVTVDVLSLMTELSQAMGIIENDFLQLFSHIP